MFPTNDTEYQESKIETVESCAGGWTVKHSNGWCLFVKKYGAEPKAGMIMRTYGKGIGSEVRGIFIDGAEVRYETELQVMARHASEFSER